MSLKPTDLMIELEKKEKELLDRHYNVIMNDCLDFKNIDIMNEKRLFIKDLKKRTLLLIKMEQRFDNEIKRIIKFLEEF